ncbi:hypothetical protein HMPREF3156_02386, partial [Neisseria sp. HMSC06F02]
PDLKLIHYIVPASPSRCLPAVFSRKIMPLTPDTCFQTTCPHRRGRLKSILSQLNPIQ